MDPVLAVILSVLFLIILALPGYIMTLAIFPKKREMDLLERVAVGIALSIVVLPALMLFEIKLFGIRFNTAWAIANVVFVCIVSALYWAVKTSHLPAGPLKKVIKPIPREEAEPFIPNLAEILRQ